MRHRSCAMGGRCLAWHRRRDPARGLCRTPNLTTDQGSRNQNIRWDYFDKGNMAVVGKNFAILESGRLRMSGFVTWLIWVFLHLMSLPQLQEPIACAIRVVLVLFYWAAQLAIDPGAARGWKAEPRPLSIPRHHECGAHILRCESGTELTCLCAVSRAREGSRARASSATICSRKFLHISTNSP